MGFFKTQKEKAEGMKERKKLKEGVQRRKGSRMKAFQKQNKKNEEMRNLYRERIREERRLREKRNSED